MITFSLVGEVLEVVEIVKKKVKARLNYIVYTAVPRNRTNKDELIIMPLHLTGTEEETNYILEVLQPHHWYIFTGTISIVHVYNKKELNTWTYFKIQSVIPLGVERTENIEEMKLIPEEDLVKSPSKIVGKLKLSKEKFEALKRNKKE